MTARPQIDVHGPSAEAPAFKARLDQYAAELAEDLGIGRPTLSFGETSRDERHVMIANQSRPVAAQRWSPGAPDPLAEAEAAAAALFRHRWLLLEPALAECGVPYRPALRQAADAGLTLSELIDLDDAQPSEDGLLWEAAELHPPTLGFIHGEVDLPHEQLLTAVKNGAEVAADLLGFEVPVPALTADAELAPSRFRLRLRKIRGPIEPDPIDSDTAAVGRVTRAAYMRIGPQLLDGKVLLSRLLDPKAVQPDYARKALRSIPTLLRVVEVVRPLLSEGYVLIDAVLFCEAILASERSAEPGEALGKGKILVLPGPLKPPGRTAQAEDALSAHIRAALVAASLRVRANWSGEQTRISAVVLAQQTLDVLRHSEPLAQAWVNRFADRIFAVATGEADVLLVPEDVRKTVRSLLADRIAGLPIIGPLECPEGIELMKRGKGIAIPPETRK